MNARFWIWWNDSWAKITLRPHQTISICHGGQTDEGFSVETEIYQNDGSQVVCSIRHDSVDCDGPHWYCWDGFCPFDQLKGHEADEHGPARPTWQRESSSQRDLYAEMANY